MRDNRLGESPAENERITLTTAAAIAQGAYYVVTGWWPIIHSASFERITGPKVDLWLVKTTGALIGVMGTVLLLAGLRRRPSLETSLVGVGGALSLGGADIIYAVQKRIWPVYLFDAAVELGCLALWTAAFRSERRRSALSDLQV